MTQPPRVVLAADHAGFPLKEDIKAYLQGKKIDVIDTGVFSTDPIDYPGVMRKGAGAVLEHGCPGIFFGRSGNGEAIAANKVRGIRAALCYSDEITKLARAHNDANVMCLGGSFVTPAAARAMVGVFLSTPFEGGRHTARVHDLEP